MRSWRVYHSIAIFCIFLYAAFRLATLVRLFVVREDQDIIIPAELAPEGKDPSSQPIPKIIHQVFLGFDNSTLPQHWEASRQTCIDLHPDYEYILWTAESVRNLLVTRYPWFVKTYENYRYNVQRADSIRYFLLAEFGGTYIDLDDGCKRRLDPLLQFDAWMPGVSTSAGFSNHVMATSPGHPYFKLVVESLPSYDRNFGTPYLTIMGSSGPHMVTFVWKRYLSTDPLRQQPRVRILMPGENGLMDEFFHSVQGGTWHTWDVRFFRWASHHLPVVIVLGPIGLLLLASILWLLLCTTFASICTLFRSQTRNHLPFWPARESKRRTDLPP